MEEFILADIKRRLVELREQVGEKPMEQEHITVQTTSSNDQRFERLNVLLQDAESKAIAREQIGPLNPHINTLKGPKWKVLIKRGVRKLIWWFIRPIVEQQSWHNELSNAISNELRDSVCLLKELAEENCRLHIELDYARNIEQSELAEIKENFASDLAAIKGNFASELVVIKGNFSSEFALLKENSLNEFAMMKESFANELTVMKECLADSMVNKNEQYTDCMNELEKMRGQLKTIQEKQMSTEESVFDYIDYYTFEDIFRGNQKEIRSRSARYLKYFELGEKVVDLGCGRGEWLELLMDKGIDAIGVDISESFVSMCQNKGLNAVHEDMFDYLEKQPDRSLDGITAIQVIEHITPVSLARLIKLCYRKLKIGGRVVFETQNPMSVSTLTHNFYVDPTHIRPVHPLWLEYLMKANSFTSVSMDYPEYAWVTDGSIPPLPGEQEDIEQFNQKIEYLNNFLYGSTDYAAIAKK